MSRQQQIGHQTMTYQITLIKADIRNPMDGTMLLGLNYEDEQKATLEYSWDAENSSSSFSLRL